MTPNDAMQLYIIAIGMGTITGFTFSALIHLTGLRF